MHLHRQAEHEARRVREGVLGSRLPLDFSLAVGHNHRSLGHRPRCSTQFLIAVGSLGIEKDNGWLANGRKGAKRVKDGANVFVLGNG
jgi:hypothetical protein